MEKNIVSESCKARYNLDEYQGRNNLVKALTAQNLLRNIPNITIVAEKFLNASTPDEIEIMGYAQGDTIYTQGNFGDFLFFILSGSCSLFTNHTFVRKLETGQFFGEFPILDANPEYYVTVRCSEDKTCIAKVSESKLNEIAQAHPEIWKNMAKIIAQRLKESNEEKYNRIPHPRPKVFIGCSGTDKALDVAREIQSELDDFECVIWDQGSFDNLNKSYLDSLEAALNEHDFGIFIFTPDDEIKKDGESKKVPRDNVIFELGMCLGKLTRDKAYLVCPRDEELEIFSDLRGITLAKYNTGNTNLRAALGPACNVIRKKINSVYLLTHEPK